MKQDDLQHYLHCAILPSSLYPEALTQKVAIQELHMVNWRNNFAKSFKCLAKEHRMSNNISSERGVRFRGQSVVLEDWFLVVDLVQASFPPIKSMTT